MASKIILGLDEVGRGPWAGPLVVGAAILGPSFLNFKNFNPQHPTDSSDLTTQATSLDPPMSELYQSWQALTDSKKLSAKRRTVLSDFVLKNAAATGLGWASSQEIDRYGLGAALKLAARRATKIVLKQKIPFDTVIIDGTINLLENTPLEQKVTLLKKADLLVKEVSAASIIAKVARDNYMIALSRQYPNYGFEKHVGYGTAAHKTALLHLGPCPEHRFSFHPIQNIAQNFDPVCVIHPRQNEILEHNHSSNQAPDTPSLQSTTARGQHAERAIIQYLIAKNHQIIAHNFRTATYEIDIISQKNQNIYFTEVKYRETSSHGDGLAQITKTKYTQMSYAANKFLSENYQFSSLQPLLAVASVSGKNYTVNEWLILEE